MARHVDFLKAFGILPTQRSTLASHLRVVIPIIKSTIYCSATRKDEMCRDVTSVFLNVRICIFIHLVCLIVSVKCKQEAAQDFVFC